MRNRPGRHFLQIPGPTNVPGRVLEAIGRPTIDHRGPEFATLGRECLDAMRRMLGTKWDASASSRPPAPGRGRRPSSTPCRRETGCSSTRPATSRASGRRWPGASASTSRRSRGTGARGSTRERSRRPSPGMPAVPGRSGPSRCSTTRPQPGRRATCRPCGGPSMRPATPRSSSWTPSPRSPPCPTSTTNGGWT